LEALAVTTDVAAGAGMSLEGASLLVAKAIAGETSALSRYGIIIEAGATQTEVMAKLTATFGGAAAAAANPLTQLGNQIGDVAQIIGDALLPMLDAIIPVIVSTITQLQKWTEENPELTRVIILATVALGGLLLVLGPLLIMLPGIVAAAPAVAAAMTVMFGPVGVAVVALAALAVGVGLIINKFKDMGKVTSQGSDEMQKLIEASNLFADEALPRVSKSASDFQSELEAINGLGEKFPEWANDMRQSLVQSLDASSSSVSDLEAEMMELGVEVIETYSTWRDEAIQTSSLISELLGEEGNALAKRFEEEAKMRADALADQRAISSQISEFKAEEIDVVTSAYTRQTQAVQGLSAEFSKASNMVEQRAEQFSKQQKPNALNPDIFGPADGSVELPASVLAIINKNFMKELEAIMGPKKIQGLLNPSIYNDKQRLATPNDMDEIGSYKHGGIVPGRAGIPVPIIAHGGEEFLGVGGGRGGARASAIINVNFNGPVFGEQDLKDKVSEIWLDVARAGGFEGVL
jgi:hypothetical protein